MSTEAIIAIAGIIGGIITKIVDFMIATYKSTQQRKKQLSGELSRMHEIHQVLQRVVAETSVQRALILRMHNGGSRPTFDKPLYISILYEQYIAPLKSILSVYQRVQADAKYIEMLVELDRKKKIRLETNKLDNGLLKSAYESENINYSEVFYLTHNENSFYYLSFSTTLASKYDNHDQRNVINVSVARLRGLFDR